MNIKRKKQEYYFKRNLILEAAKKIFFEKGFDLATIDDIATKANYSKGSIYSYFKSKNEICFSIVNGYYKDILELFRGINELNISGLKKLIKIKLILILKKKLKIILLMIKYHLSLKLKKQAPLLG